VIRVIKFYVDQIAIDVVRTSSGTLRDFAGSARPKYFFADNAIFVKKKTILTSSAPRDATSNVAQ
jgi:hypothetical protein